MPHNEKTEAQWEAENDANTLIRAEEIKADEQRLKAAQNIADDMAVEQREKAQQLDKIANNPDSPPPGDGNDNTETFRRSSGANNSTFLPPLL